MPATAPEFQSFEVKDFSGGRTDNYVAGPANRYKLADNLLIIKYGDVGKLKLRPGSELYSTDYPLVNPAAERIGAIKNFKTNSNDYLIVFSARKAFMLTAGVGWGELTYINSIFDSSSSVNSVVSYAEWNDHLLVTNSDFPPISKIYNTGSSVALRTAGLPALASSPTVTRGAAGTGTYIYKFLYKYAYTANTVDFVDRGAITTVELDLAAAPNTNNVAITAIPVLANGVLYNWDTTTITVEIYRTTDAGFTFYYVGQVTNGTTVYTDSTSDTTLQTHALLYTEGGVVENDAVPLAKLVHVTGDIAYYAHIKSGTQVFANRLMQAVPGDPDSVPGDFYVDVQDPIVGLSSTRGFPILLCQSSVYRVDGQFDLLGNGGMIAQKISDTATCISSQSVVQTIEGVFWAGEDSYYFTDGYQVIKLCEDWVETYQSRILTAAQMRRIQGKYDRRNRRIWWSVQEDSGGTDECNSCDILNLDWGIKRDASFTSASGGEEFTPTSLEFIDGVMLRGDRSGFLLSHSVGLATDVKVDAAIDPSLWVTKPILWDYQSCAFDMGNNHYRKYSNKFEVTCKNESNLSLQVISINDDGRKIENLKPIRFRGNTVWGEETAVWGDPNLVWGFDGIIENQRRFPASSLRYSYKQIRMINATVAILSSDSLGLVSTDATTKAAVLLTSAAWPETLVDYTISFSNDSYVKEYTITAVSGNTVTFSDPDNTISTYGSIEWVIRGIPKGEVFQLLTYTVSFVYMGQTQTFYTAAESGEVGT
jgi:hypothetical protein